MVAYTKPQLTKEERRKRKAKRRDRDQIKFIVLRFERWQVVRLSELCWGKAMVAYTKPQLRKKEESERLRGEIEIRSSLLILDLKDGKLQDSGKQEEGKTFHKLHVLGMNDDLWDRVREVCSGTWKGCE